jgi:two-component system response regulator CpxR
MMSRVLVIDDDNELCELLCEYLQSEGFIVETTGDSRQGIDRALSGEHSIIVLDVMLPEISGLEVLRRIRVVSAVPVLMLTARGDEVDRIVGLEMGADDYLPKPFNPRELVARLRAIRRRSGEGRHKSTVREVSAPLVVGDLVLDPGTRMIKKAGRRVSVTGAEFSLLWELLQQAGRVVSRDRLTELVLNRKMTMFDRSIDVHISSLRRKLGPAGGDGERIKAIRGVGYLYVIPTAGA